MPTGHDRVKTDTSGSTGNIADDVLLYQIMSPLSTAFAIKHHRTYSSYLDSSLLLSAHRFHLVS